MIPMIQILELADRAFLTEFEKDIERWKSSKASYRWHRLLEDLVMMGVSDPTEPNELINDPQKYNQGVWELITKHNVVEPLVDALRKDLSKIAFDVNIVPDGKGNLKRTTTACTPIFSRARYAIDLLEHFLVGDTWRSGIEPIKTIKSTEV